MSGTAQILRSRPEPGRSILQELRAPAPVIVRGLKNPHNGTTVAVCVACRNWAVGSPAGVESWIREHERDARYHTPRTA